MGVKIFIKNSHLICLQAKYAETGDPQTGSIFYVEFSLTQTAYKISHRSNPFLFHYPYGLGADNGDIRFVF